MNTINSPYTYSHTSIKQEQLDNLVPKLWGHEEWIVNNAQYCGKKLVFKQHHGCSLHYHKVKHETFYVLTGKLILELQEAGQQSLRIIEAGDIAQIKQYTQHRLIALTDAQVMEFSTYHCEEDSYRSINAKKFELCEIEALSGLR